MSITNTKKWAKTYTADGRPHWISGDEIPQSKDYEQLADGCWVKRNSAKLELAKEEDMVTKLRKTKESYSIDEKMPILRELVRTKSFAKALEKRRRLLNKQAAVSHSFHAIRTDVVTAYHAAKHNLSPSLKRFKRLDAKETQELMDAASGKIPDQEIITMATLALEYFDGFNKESNNTPPSISHSNTDSLKRAAKDFEDVYGRKPTLEEFEKLRAKYI